jgi:protein gp37
VGDKSAIQWTDATWNPTTGCDRVSPGCAHCYALDLAARLKAMGATAYQNDGDPKTSGPGFALTEHWDRLDIPMRWQRPRRVFVNSMSDLFHPDVSLVFLSWVFTTMAATPRHTYQVLTKRPERARALMGSIAAGAIWQEWPPRNVWIGTSIENDRWTVRADELRAVPGEWTRFLSLEPLLGPLPSLDLTGIDWVIVGGESGPEHRPFDPDWARDLRDRCVDAGVAFFFKQHGGRTPKSGGRELDGRTWDQFPRQAVLA